MTLANRSRFLRCKLFLLGIFLLLLAMFCLAAASKRKTHQECDSAAPMGLPLQGCSPLPQWWISFECGGYDVSFQLSSPVTGMPRGDQARKSRRAFIRHFCYCDSP